MMTNRTTLLFLFCCLAVLRITAQTSVLSGRVVDADTDEALSRATTQLYHIGRGDTTFVGGAYSNAQGYFSLNIPNTGSYLLRISFLGYNTHEQPVTLTAGQKKALNKIALKPDAMQLD